jgi:hypothetical protein
MAQLELCFVSSDSVSDTTLKSGNVGSKLCSELKGPDLEYGTVDKRTRLKKKCFFCGWEYQGGPDIGGWVGKYDKNQIRDFGRSRLAGAHY